MQIFVSYASEDRPLAEEVSLALASAGHQVFFDRGSLPAGGDFHVRIQSAIQEASLFVFLISAHSLAPGAYTLTELKLAREKWPQPADHLLPVRLPGAPWENMPAYLRAVTVLEPEGNVAAEVLAAVRRMVPAPSPVPAPVPVPGKRMPWGAIVGVAVAVATALGFWGTRKVEPVKPEEPAAASAPDKKVTKTQAPKIPPPAAAPAAPMTAAAPAQLMARLEAANVKTELKRNDVVEWLGLPNRRYERLAEASLALLGSRRLKAPALIEVVMYKYVTSIGLGSDDQLPMVPTINDAKLRGALLAAYNEQNGEALTRLEDALTP